MRPVIGITSYRDRAAWGSWDAEAVVIPDAYVRKIQDAGAHADIIPGSRLSEILGDRVEVSSAHHQGIADPGKLEVSAHAHDGIIEAVEDPERRFAIGVLWHPEVRDDSRLFDALVAAART